jgi:hypothetical protein
VARTHSSHKVSLFLCGSIEEHHAKTCQSRWMFSAQVSAHSNSGLRAQVHVRQPQTTLTLLRLGVCRPSLIIMNNKLIGVRVPNDVKLMNYITFEMYLSVSMLDRETEILCCKGFSFEKWASVGRRSCLHDRDADAGVGSRQGDNDCDRTDARDWRRPDRQSTGAHSKPAGLV